MAEIENFCFKQILKASITEKRVFILGTIQNCEGEAIAILTPKPLIYLSKQQIKNISKTFKNDIYSKFTANISTIYDIQLIFPITQKHKQKYIEKQQKIHHQTGIQYQNKKQQLLKKQLSHIKWVTNILDGITQTQRVLFSHPQFKIVQDLKWNNITDKQNMHVTVLFQNKELYSIRDLRNQHLNLLEQVTSQVDGILKQKVGIGADRCRMYFHYPPTFYRLHIHIMNLKLESLSCRVERCHDVYQVIQNIKLNGDYYKIATLNTFVPTNQ